MGKTMSLLKSETASDKGQDQVNSNHNQQCEVSSNKEHDQATIQNLSRAHQNNPNLTAQNRPSNTINMPPPNKQQEGAATPQAGSITLEKDSQKMCCKNRLNRMQCAFLITGIILLVAGCITLGILLGKSWVKNSVTARTKPVYKAHFVTATGKHVGTYQVIVDQKFLFKGNTEDTFLVTTLKQPTSVGRALEQSDTATIAEDNIPAFVTLTDGAVTAKAANSDDITLLVNFDEINKQSNGVGGRLLQRSDSKELLFEQIKKEVAEKAEVDPSQVSIVEETYIKLAADEKGELVAEEIQPSRNLDEVKVVAKPAQTKEKRNYIQNALVVLRSIGQSFVDAKDKLKRYENKIAAQTKCGFKRTNDLRVSKEVTKKVGNNHLQIRREYEHGLNRKPKQIRNTIVIPVEEFEAFKHCFDHKEGKYCAKRFINRVDNPFKLSKQSRHRSNLHRQHLFLSITINDRRSNQNKQEHEQHNHAVVPSHKTKNLNKEDKQVKPVKPAEKKAEEKSAADAQKTNKSDTKKQEQSSKADSNQINSEAKGGSSSASSNQNV